MSPANPQPDFGHPAPGMHVRGWTDPPELEWLHETAATMTSVVEVGSMYGRSAYALLSACPGPVFCVDPWFEPHKYRSFFDSCGHFPNLRAVRGTSPHAAARIPDVDMVFIDGNHEYEAVVADLRAWLPKARRLICGHDYGNAEYPGVKKAVDEMFGDRVRPAIGDSWPSESLLWTVRLQS